MSAASSVVSPNLARWALSRRSSGLTSGAIASAVRGTPTMTTAPSRGETNTMTIATAT